MEGLIWRVICLPERTARYFFYGVKRSEKKYAPLPFEACPGAEPHPCFFASAKKHDRTAGKPRSHPPEQAGTRPPGLGVGFFRGSLFAGPDRREGFNDNEGETTVNVRLYRRFLDLRKCSFSEARFCAGESISENRAGGEAEE